MFCHHHLSPSYFERRGSSVSLVMDGAMATFAAEGSEIAAAPAQGGEVAPPGVMSRLLDAMGPFTSATDGSEIAVAPIQGDGPAAVRYCSSAGSSAAIPAPAAEGGALVAVPAAVGGELVAVDQAPMDGAAADGFVPREFCVHCLEGIGVGGRTRRWAKGRPSCNWCERTFDLQPEVFPPSPRRFGHVKSVSMYGVRRCLAPAAAVAVLGQLSVWLGPAIKPKRALRNWSPSFVLCQPRCV